MRSASFSSIPVSAAAVALFAGAAAAVPPAVVFDYGYIPTTGAAQVQQGQIAAAGQVRWYKFSLGTSISAAQGTYLDLDLNNTPAQLPQIGDAEMGIYSASGVLLANDDDAGTGTMPQISIGAGSRAAPASGNAYNGQNGATLNAALGPFYVAVAGFDATFGANFGTTTTATGTGFYALSIRSGKMPGFTPTPDVDLGNIRGHHSAMTSGAMPIGVQQIRWVKFHIDQPTDAAAIYCDINTAGSSIPVQNGSNLNDTELVLFAGDGTVVFANGDADDWTHGSPGFLSGVSFGRTTGARNYANGLTTFAGQNAAVLTAGDYYVAAGAFNLVSSNGFVVGADSGETGSVVVNVMTNIAPAQDYDMGLVRRINSPLTTTPITLADGETKWFKFTTEQATDAANTYVDIHTLGSNLTPGTGIPNDTVIAIYDQAGVRRGFNDDWAGRLTGANESGMSFGRTSGPRTYGAMPGFAGQDGAVLPAGSYYVGVTGYSADYSSSADYRLTSPHNRHGSIQLTVASNIGPALDVDFGLVSRANSPVAVTSLGVPALGVRWVHFKTAHATNAQWYLDMHTYGSVFTTGASAGNDTELGLFDAGGGLIANNDDWTFGGNGGRLEAALSFGAASTPRDYGIMQNFAGQHGAILYPNDYYVAIVGFDTTFANGFTVTPVNGTAGTADLTIITNLPTTPCNLADVASLGGVLGADHQLTADDIVVFLSNFFAANLAVADVAGLGGTIGADGQITVDDLVVFLSAFFSPCNP